MMSRSVVDSNGFGVSLREKRFGFRFRVRAGDSLGESGITQVACREDTRGGVGGGTSLLLPEGRVLVVATGCCSGRGRGDD
jgi:hypothetical protein